MFEQFGGRDADPEDAYLAEVETSDIYLGILGRRYGKPLPSRFSATHAEYLHAEKCGLRVAVWCLKAADREGHQESFLSEVRTFHVVPDFTTPDDLRVQVEDRLKAIAAEDLAPWCKLGNILFRATEVADNGTQLQVTARVRSDDVAHALEAMRGSDYGRGGAGLFTWSGHSRHVEVKSVETTTTTARSRLMRLRLEARDNGRDPMLEISVSGYSADDLTEAGVCTALFGTPHPLADQHLGFMGEVADPFAGLRTARVSDEVVRPVFKRPGCRAAGRGRRAPLRGQAMSLVASTRRYVADERWRLRLFECVAIETRRIAAALHEPRFSAQGSWSNDEFGRRVAVINELLAELLRAEALMGRWSTAAMRDSLTLAP
jgi:hypothetical protein